MRERQPDLVGDILLLIDRTALGQRTAPNGLEQWALDCALRAVGSDIRELEPHLRRLKADLSHARKWLRAREDEALREQLEQARDYAQQLLAGDRSKRGRAAIDAFMLALDCCAGERSYGQLSRLALAAFPSDYVREETEFQARRLLLRSKLLPSGAELLVRLDFAEARGVLPRDPQQRAWLEQQRALLMTEEEERRITVTLRYLEQVFLDEFERAR